MVSFKLKEHDANIEVFTTRPDTIFGVTFMTLARASFGSGNYNHEYQDKINDYILARQNVPKERMADVKTISGVFTGMLNILLPKSRFRFGLGIMFWQVMEQVLLWRSLWRRKRLCFC
jgi:leucyl-tRNA synthetase